MAGLATRTLSGVIRAAGAAASLAVLAAVTAQAQVDAGPGSGAARGGSTPRSLSASDTSGGGTGRTPAGASDADVVPIRRITLYRSGVGFFERSGMIQGDVRLQLRFKTEEINDIIKSMVLLDRGGGRIDSVSYGSKEPLNRRLASFGVNISGNPSVPQLLDQLRGASIKVTASGEQVAGTILGVEQRRMAPQKDQPAYDTPVLNLVTGAGMRSIAICDISSFDILDKQLSEELSKALAALAEYRADRSKTVDVNFSGTGVAGAREVIVGYVHEMPVWKTTYRIILPQQPGTTARPATAGAPPEKTAPAAIDAPKSKVALQGWAIVENNTDQDWHDVRLGLVSGRPVSFQMDLYEPLFVTRPYVPVPTIPGVAPRAYSGGVDLALGLALQNAPEAKPGDPGRPTGMPATAAFDIAGRVENRSALSRKDGAKMKSLSEAGSAGQSAFIDDQNGDGDGKAQRDRYVGVNAGDMADYAAAAQAAGGEVGEVFQFELESPVTLERQRSAMIPIMSTSIAGRRVSIYSADMGGEHPMRGVELTNDSGLQLIPGPITVFDGNDSTSAYAGDAQIGHVGPGDKRLLAYAVDLDVAALTKPESTSTLTKIRIIHGVYEATSKVRNTTIYGFENKDKARPRAVIVEHPKADGWVLIEPTKAAEVTQGMYRFEVPIDAGKTGTLTVAQEQVQSQTVGLNTWNENTMAEFRRNGQLSQAVLDAFRQFAAKQMLIAQTERGVAEIDRQIAEVSTDQGRIRGNMGQIDHNSQLYTRYMTKLNEQESKLEDLTERRVKEQERLETARKDLESYLSNLSVE